MRGLERNSAPPAQLARQLAASIAGVQLGSQLRQLRPGDPGPDSPGELLSVPTRGATVCVTADRPGTGSISLAFALAARHGGRWCAAVGLPELGAVAAGEYGLAPGRLVAVDPDRQRWVQTVAACLDGFDTVLARPAAPIPGADARRLTNRARERGALLLVLGGWEGATARLRVLASQWQLLADHRGGGLLLARSALVRAEARAAPAERWIWLPAPAHGPEPTGPDHPRTRSAAPTVVPAPGGYRAPAVGVGVGVRAGRPVGSGDGD